MSVSPQSAFVVQQFGMSVFWQVCVVRLHASVVHESPSLHSVFVLQHPLIAMFVHICDCRSQMSTVQVLLSLHWAFVVHAIRACSVVDDDSA